MSAYEVGKAHIDAMLTAGFAFSQHGNLRWMVGLEQHPDYEHAHQAGAPWGPAAGRISRDCSRELTRDTAGRVGAVLMAENRRSVNHRYDEAEIEWPYEYRELPGRPDAVLVLKAIACYEYQSCEHPEWQGSEAFAFCQSLKEACIRALPGYDDAPAWEITSTTVFVDEVHRKAEAERIAREQAAARKVASELTRDDVIAEIKRALKERSGKTWSVTGGRGTAWGWLRISSPPKQRDHWGSMMPADSVELAKLLDINECMATGSGVSVPSGSDHWAEFIDRANGRKPTLFGRRDWD